MLAVGVSDTLVHASYREDITVLHGRLAWIRQSGF